MKIEDLKTQEQLNLYVVSQQRELLIAFTEWVTTDIYDTKKEIETDVDIYLEAINCG